MSTAPDPSGHVVHEIRWSDALPWWLLFRAAAAAFSPTVILLAALGAVATWAGWTVADKLGLPGADPIATEIASGEGIVLPVPAGVAMTPGPLEPSRAAVPWLHVLIQRVPRPIGDLLTLVAIPTRPTSTVAQSGAALARLGWLILVWSIFGTGIARHVGLRLAGEDAPGPLGALLFGSRSWLPAFNAVLFVLCGIAALSVPGALLGLAMRTDWGLAAAGVVWPLVLLGAVVLAILAAGLAVGWPLMVACVGVERGDSFQAISTAFSYVYQRPLHYVFYGLVALAVAVPALAAAALFADLTGTLAVWAASFGMGHARTEAVIDGLASGAAVTAPWGVRAIGFWHRSLAHLLASFGWGYFWAFATSAYLLLRRDVDGTELDEVVIDEPGEQ